MCGRNVACCLLFAVWSAYCSLSIPVKTLLMLYCTDTVVGVQSVMHVHTVGTNIMPDIEKLTHNFATSSRFAQK